MRGTGRMAQAIRIILLLQARQLFAYLLGAVTLLSNPITTPSGPGGGGGGGTGGGGGGGGTPTPTPAPSTLILVITALACVGIYQTRERLLKLFRRN